MKREFCAFLTEGMGDHSGQVWKSMAFHRKLSCYAKNKLWAMCIIPAAVGEGVRAAND